MVIVPKSLRLWGLMGAMVAAAFAIWMLFFPQFIPGIFAWDVKPRMAQVFIGAGYIFRTYFFLLFVFERDYRTLRWAHAGNLAFTGVLLLATVWHAESMNWLTIAGHLWIVFYTMEPITMHYSVPRLTDDVEPLPSRGVLSPWFRRLFILEVAIFGLMGLLFIINPEWTNVRWAWELNPFDARIVAAWWVGWAAWSGWMASAADWAEVRLAAIGQLVLLLALNLCNALFFKDFRANSPTLLTYTIGAAILLVAVAVLIWRQERNWQTRSEVPPVVGAGGLAAR